MSLSLCGIEPIRGTIMIDDDIVNHPNHYKQVPNIEAIDVVSHFNFCMGSAIKYIWRADHKGDPITDLRKSIWFLNREIEIRLLEQNQDMRMTTPTVLDK
jgi:hypothetical protein